MAQDAFLRPMAPDALLRKTGSTATRLSPSTTRAVHNAAQIPQSAIRPTQSAARSVQAAAEPSLQAGPQPEQSQEPFAARPVLPPQPAFFDPLAGLENVAPDLLTDPDDDWPDDTEADAVPTASMAVPVPVPLYDLAPQRTRHTGLWIALCTLMLLGAAGFVLWRMGYIPFW